jgi:hypothetical protein
MAATALAMNGEALPDREAVEAEIERLIDLLDKLDGDCDFEPSLGVGGCYASDDREGDNADDEDCGDFEPWLGAPETSLPSDIATHCVKAAFFNAQYPHLNEGQERTRHCSQMQWAGGGSDDLELAIDECANVE